MRWIKAAAAAVALVALLVVPPWALIEVIGNPWPPEGISLSAPLTDGAIIGLLAVVVWVLWAQVVTCVVVETVAALSADQITVRAPLTLGVQQQLARRLVTAVVVAGVATPAVLTGASAEATATAPATAPAGTLARPAGDIAPADHGPDQKQMPGATRAQQHAGTAGPDGADADQIQHPAQRQREHHTVTVMRLDTLMGIAHRVLGDPERWEEIAVLNEGKVMNDGTVFHSADYIRPGWELLVPHEATNLPRNQASERIVVASGDSLSQLAAEHLGDAKHWPVLYEANMGVIGADPDLIYPGQVLAVPETGTAGVEQGAAVDRMHVGPGAMTGDRTGGDPRADQRAAEGSTDLRERAERRRSSTPGTRVDPPRQATQSAANSPQQDSTAAAIGQQGSEAGITALRALLASAVCLSVGALGLVAANRRRQFRRRGIGRMIASTPPNLAEVEDTIVEHGSGAHADVQFLDRALRHVAAVCRATGTPLPQVGAAVLGSEELRLLFTHPATGQAPEGWAVTEDATAWMLPRSTVLAEDLETQAAPYPALVSIGHDEDGRTWLQDLETVGVCGIAGDPGQVADLARFLVAELAVNAWAEGSEVLLAEEFASQMTGLNPARLRAVDRSDALARAAALTGEMGEVEQNLDADVLTRRRDGLLTDTTNPVVVVAPSRPEDEFVTDLEHRDRSRVILVHGDQESPAVELTAEGKVFLPRWGVSLTAFTLSPAEAEAMAALMATPRNATDQQIPATESEAGPLGKYARVDGSLRVQYTEPRHTQESDPSSLLPEPDEVYVATAATTPVDMAALAPSVPEETREEIEALDPGLDVDLADWFDESSPRPKVRLLGPVNVTARNGGDSEAITNLAGTVAFIAYLACQERGVTGERAAEAFGWTTQKTVQNRATNARFLLGPREDGSDWLPDASTSEGARRGTPTYELIKGTGGVLVDFDLFVRLRFRAQKAGDTGCETDLVTALSLVEGAPFEAATDRRFPWLFTGQRHDDIMVAAIHDLAHVLATRAATDGRTDLVRLACETARKASPHSDVAWLDLAAATEADAGRADAEELLQKRIVDHVDEDLPPRTEAVMDQRGWLTG